MNKRQKEKIQILRSIGDLLLENDMEVVVTDFPELRKCHSSLKPYCIAFDTRCYDCEVVRPWSGSDECWVLDYRRITLSRLIQLKARCLKAVEEKKVSA